MTFLGYPNLYDLLSHIGLMGILIVVFLEMGIFVCFFFPGDSLLLVAGVLAAKGTLNLAHLMLMVPLVACVGYGVSYAIGSCFKNWFWSLKDGLFFKRAYLAKAHDFYNKYGSTAIVVGRFMPIFRTFLPVSAGIARMPWVPFLWSACIGGFIWADGLLLSGYGLARFAPSVLNHMTLLLICVIALSLLPAIIGAIKSRKPSQ